MLPMNADQNLPFVSFISATATMSFKLHAERFKRV